MPAWARWLRPSINWLLVFIPVPLIAELAHQPLLTFVTAPLAIVPLAGLIGRATDQLAIRVGPQLGGLLNATFGNLTELIVAVLLIAAGNFEVVKASLIGSIVGNLLLVLGLSLFVGGLRCGEQAFSARAAGVFTQFSNAHLFRTPASSEHPEWSRALAVGVLLGAALLVGLESELLVSALNPSLQTLKIVPIFVGLILIPVIGNAAEHASAVFFAIRNKVDVTLEIAVGSSTQVALFVAPIMVFISVLLGRPMDFVFPGFEIGAVFIATLIVAVISRDGHSNWLEGLQLIGVYVILALAAFFL